MGKYNIKFMKHKVSNFKFKDVYGQSLIEIIIAMAIGVLMIGAALTTIIPTLRSNQETKNIQTATSLVQEYLDNLQNLAESKWSNIYSPPTAKGPNSTFYLQPTGITYMIISGTTSTVIDGLIFTQYFSIENVNRNLCAGSDITTTSITTCLSGPGSVGVADDPSTQKITATVSWPDNHSISRSRYLTRNRNKVFVQTDWSGGPNQEGPITLENNKFANSSNIDYTTSAGSISASSLSSAGLTSSIFDAGVSADIDTGLVGYWKFDETIGITASDSSGNGNNGTLINGPTWVAGKINNALNFDGSNDYVSTPLSLQLGLSGTVSAWVKFDTLNTDDLIIGQYSGYPIKYFWMGTTVDGKYNFAWGGAATDYKYTTAHGLVVGQWYHFVMVRDASNSVILYVNGSQVASFVPSTTNVTSNSINIGNINGLSGFEFDGLIDDVRIYNRALSTSEIQELYNGTGTFNTVGVAINTIMWQGVQAALANVQFQIASDSISTPTTWNYKGPDGTNTTYYTPTGPNVPIQINLDWNNNHRFFRYKIFLSFSPGATQSPRVDDVIINYSK